MEYNGGKWNHEQTTMKWIGHSWKLLVGYGYRSRMATWTKIKKWGFKYRFSFTKLVLPNKWESFSMECSVSFRVGSGFLQCNRSSVRPDTPRFLFPWCFCRQNQEGYYSWNTHCSNQGYYLPETHSVRRNTHGFLFPLMGQNQEGPLFQEHTPVLFLIHGDPFPFPSGESIIWFSFKDSRVKYTSWTDCVLCVYLLCTVYVLTHLPYTHKHYCLHLLSVYCAQLALLHWFTLMLRTWLHTYGTCVKWASPGGQVLFWNQYV